MIPFGNLRSYMLYSCKKYWWEMWKCQFRDSIREKNNAVFFISLCVFWGTVKNVLFTLTLSWRRPLLYRNQSIDLLYKSIDWFLYDNGLRHERVIMNIKKGLRCLRCECFEWFYLQNLDVPDDGTKKITSDAMLCCPGCMITVCFDCQR